MEEMIILALKSSSRLFEILIFGLEVVLKFVMGGIFWANNSVV